MKIETKMARLEERVRARWKQGNRLAREMGKLERWLENLKDRVWLLEKSLSEHERSESWL